jgi:ribose 5-phosphate isomerase A
MTSKQDLNQIQNRLKEQAAKYAVEFVRSNMVLGLGSGSTAKFALQEIGTRIKKGKLKNIVGIPSSNVSASFASKVGIPITSFAEFKKIDLTIDGADEVDPNLNLIKGGGGALLREKIIAQASQHEIIVVDESKLSKQLGLRWAVPVEVIPFAWQMEEEFLKSLGARITLRKNKEQSIFKTDQGNYILDCDFGPIADVQQLARQLNLRAAIMEHGLFIGLATEVIVAGKEGIRHLKA